MSETAGTGRRRRALLVLTLGLGALTVPASAGGQAPEPPPFSAAEASAQLDQAVDALTGTAPGALDPTDELRHLAAALPYLEGAEKRSAKRVLARPPAGETGPADAELGAVWSASATQDRETYDSPGGQFRIHYVTSSEDAPPATDVSGLTGVPDYVELVAARADQSEQVLNDELAWPAPKSDGGKGDLGGPATSRTDIYLSDLADPAIGVLYGYASPDDSSATCSRPPFQCSAYLVLDDDYAEIEYGNGGDPEIPLSVTVAHEYNHVLQFRLAAMQDTWMFESTAVWAEEQVFPAADDWVATYMARWAKTAFIPITDPTARRFYGTAVWNHWLERGAGYGDEVILDSWRQSRKSKPKGNAVGAYDLGIKRSGGPGFANEFGRFTAATAEWRVVNGDFPDQDQLPGVRREGGLRVGARGKRFKLDHTAYRLLRVDPRAEDIVRLRVRAPRGVRTAIALVGRHGDPLTGNVVTKRHHLRRGGKDSIKLANAQDFARITAVVTNADGRVRRGTYTRDNERFRANLR